MESIQKQKNGGCLRTLGIMLVTVVISVVATVLVLNYYIFPKRFDTVELNNKETQVLAGKLEHMGLSTELASGESKALTPEPYTEVGAKREVNFTERELNAMLAKNTDLADKMAIDLADDLASAKAIIPVDPDFPFLGGKTIKVSAGMELAYRNDRPVVVLKGVSVWGVPVPNAWLGNLKNVDLVKEFGANEGFWKSFADGVEYIRVEEGRLKVKLKE